MFSELFSLSRPASANAVEKKIVSLVQTAAQHVPLYRERFRQAGFDHREIASLSDYVERFPTITSSDYRTLQQERGHAYCLDERYNIADLKADRSSGSSGIPISVYRTKAESERTNRAKTLWFLMRAGLRPWHRTMASVPPIQVRKRDSFVQRLGIFHRTTVTYSMSPDQVIEIIERERINAAYGQKSFLGLVAERYDQLGKSAPRLRLLIPGAERLDPTTKALFERVFRPNVFAEFYGATETGIIGVRIQDVFIVNYNDTFFYLLRPETSAGLTRGSIVVTSTDARAQPMLGLELGDEVVVRNYNRVLQLGADITEVSGRENDYLLLSDGGKISGATFYAAFEYFSFVRRFRIVQEGTDCCRILISLIIDNEENRARVDAKAREILSGKIPYQLEFVSDIPMEPNGKRKILVSDLVAKSSSGIY